VKCGRKRGWANSQRRISVVEWVEELSQITCLQPGRDLLVNAGEEPLEFDGAVPGGQLGDDHPEATSEAAYRLVVPWQRSS
jgi:hypothetical protein